MSMINRIPLLCMVLLIFCNWSLHASIDPSKIEEQLKEAIDDLGGDEEDASLKLFNESFDFFKESDDLNNWLKWHRNVVKQFRKKKNIEAALSFFSQGENGMWRQAANDKEYYSLARLYAEIGTLYYDLGEYNPAKKYYLLYSELLAEKTNKPATFVAKYAYRRLANIYSGLRDIEKSKYYWDKVKSISWAAQKWDMWAAACESLALAHNSVGEYQQAVASIEEGLQLIDSVSFDTKILMLTSLGINHYHLRNYKQARHYTDLAADLLNENLGNLKSKKLYSYQYPVFYNYGRINKGEKNYLESERFYQKALNLHQQGLIELSRRRLAIMHFNFGQLYLEWGDYKKAEDYHQIAIKHLLPILTNREDPDLAFSGTLTAEPLLAHAFEVMGTINMTRYKDSGEHTDLEAAIANYELAAAVGALLLQNYTTENSRLTALKKQRELKSVSINAYFDLYQSDQKETWKEKLFNISERSKAFLQLESARLSSQAKQWGTAQQSQYYQTKAHLASLETAIYQLQQSNTNENNPLLDSLKNAYLKTSDTFAKIRQEGNGTEKSRTKNQLVSVEDIQQNLDSDLALIEYFVDDDAVYIFCISKNDFSVYKEAIDSSFFDRIQNFRSILIEPNFNKENRISFAIDGHALYNTLLKKPLHDLSKEVKRLVFVRDHSLNYLPFEAMLDEPAEEKGYFEMPYLLRNYSCSYAATAALFLLQQDVAQGRASSLYRGYAPSYSNQKVEEKDTTNHLQYALLVRSGEYELKGAQREVNKVATALNGQVSVGESASEEQFKSEAQLYQILHLSMHALMNETNPKFSKLLFTRGSSGKDEDDNLHVVELYGMQLNADLAVLSACETGIGKLYPGEGVMSLSRAFFEAGVPGTVMSLWQVEDDATSAIIISFFNFLKQGLTKDQALQQAKLAYLNSTNMKTAHPYFWSGLTLAGNNDRMNIDTGVKGLWYYLLGGLMAFTFIAYYYRRKTRA